MSSPVGLEIEHLDPCERHDWQIEESALYTDATGVTVAEALVEDVLRSVEVESMFVLLCTRRDRDAHH